MVSDGDHTTVPAGTVGNRLCRRTDNRNGQTCMRRCVSSAFLKNKVAPFKIRILYYDSGLDGFGLSYVTTNRDAVRAEKYEGSGDVVFKHNTHLWREVLFHLPDIKDNVHPVFNSFHLILRCPDAIMFWRGGGASMGQCKSKTTPLDTPVKSHYTIAAYRKRQKSYAILFS